MKKNNKKIILAISIIIATIAIVAGIMTIGNKKKSTEISKEKTEDYSIKITNKSAESEKIKISIENVAYADKYLILDYNVIAENTEEPFFLENYAKKNEFGLYIDQIHFSLHSSLKKMAPQYFQLLHYSLKLSICLHMLHFLLISLFFHFPLIYLLFLCYSLLFFLLIFLLISFYFQSS